MDSEDKNRIPIKSLRTYQGDVEETLSKNKVGASSILVAEQKRRNFSLPAQDRVANSGLRNKFFIVLGITLFLFGIIVVGAVYYLRSSEQVVITQKTKALIGFSEEKVLLVASSTRADLVKKIVAEKNSFKRQPNAILYINTTDTTNNPLSISEILRLLSPKMPASLARSFENKYMLGIYSFDTNEPFIIIRTNDFASSFEGMLKWEKDITSDLGEIFSISQTTSDGTPVFVDEAFRNKDLRVIRDADNKIVLLYSFIDKNTLVITGSENVFTAIIGKYLVTKQTETK